MRRIRFFQKLYTFRIVSTQRSRSCESIPCFLTLKKKWGERNLKLTEIMKILLTGGGSGGHFYPIIAIAQELNQVSKDNRLLKPELFFMSTDPYNESLLYENNITFVKVSAGKIRKHLNIQNIILNILDLFKTFTGVLTAIWKMFSIYPDVVFGKGAYNSFPALFAARLFRIPVVIHESDSSPGKVNAWASKFAARIAISYPEAGAYFPKEKTAYTGCPIRKEVIDPMTNDEARKLLELEAETPTILIMGGSQGAKFVNEAIMDIIAQLVVKYQVVHQTGKKNIEIIKKTAEVVLQYNSNKDRYKPLEYLNLLQLRAAAGAADLVISRAGSTIFEIASWEKPAILIPIPEPTSHDQRKNAYSYARAGGAIVIEEKNLAPGVLFSEITRIIEDKDERERMKKGAKSFARRDSAKLIAEEILEIAVSHEK